MRLKWSILRNSRWQKEKETKKNKNERGKEESDKHWKKPAIKNSCFLPWRLPCPPQKKKKKKKKIFSVPILKFALVSKKKNESESEEKWWIRFERSPEQARTSVTHLFSAHFLRLNCSSWWWLWRYRFWWILTLEWVWGRSPQPKKLPLHMSDTSKWDERKITATTRKVDILNFFFPWNIDRGIYKQFCCFINFFKRRGINN